MNELLTVGLLGPTFPLAEELAPDSYSRLFPRLELAAAAEPDGDQFVQRGPPEWKLRLVGNEGALFESSNYVGRDADTLPAITWEELGAMVRDHASAFRAMGFETDDEDHLIVSPYPQFLLGLERMMGRFLGEPRITFHYQAVSLIDGGDVVSLFWRTRLRESRACWSARVVFEPGGDFCQVLAYLSNDRLAPRKRRTIWDGGDFREPQFKVVATEPLAGFMITDVGD